MQNSLTKKLGLTLGAFAMAVTSLFTASDAQAVPAFARQTGMTCNSCHFQGFPSLNGMGRSFRAGGYTMKGTLTDIEGEDMSLPSVMPLAIFWKGYYVTSIVDKGTAAELSEFHWMDEWVLFAAGRMAANAGFLFEIGDGAATNSKLVFNVAQAGSTSISVIPWSTDAAGSTFGMELMNTGTQRSQRPIEKMKAMTGARDFINSSGTGLSIVASDLSTGWWVNFSQYGPVHNGGQDLGLGASLTGMATSIRAGYFFDLAGFDTGVAYLGQSGTVKAGMSADGETAGSADQNLNVDVAGSVIDFQMQGQVGGSDLGIYVSMVTAGDSDTATNVTSKTELDADGTTLTSFDENINTGHYAGGASTTGLLVKYSATPAVHVLFGTNSGSYGDATNSYSVVGAHYMYAQNVRLVAESYTEKKGDNDASSSLTLGWMAGF